MEAIAVNLGEWAHSHCVIQYHRPCDCPVSLSYFASAVRDRTKLTHSVLVYHRTRAKRTADCSSEH